MPRALIVGCDGQDGSYLTPLLQGKGYQVTGVDRQGPEAAVNICDLSSLGDLLHRARPDEIYHLAAFHHSAEDAAINDYELVEQSLRINTLSLHNILYTVAQEFPACRIFYAASSRVFGHPQSEGPQGEDTPLNPACPYGISKTAGIHLCHYYRRARKVHCSVGILYNHESPRRAAQFVTQKVVRAAVRVKKGLQDKVTIGNLDALVDWGYAPDFVDAMWRILQLDTPEDCIIASGSLHSVKELLQVAFGALGLPWEDHVSVDRTLVRAGSPEIPLRGDASKLRALTGWQPTTSFEDMVKEMVGVELGRVEA